MKNRYKSVGKRLLCMALAILLAGNCMAETAYATPIVPLTEHEITEEVPDGEVQEDEKSSEFSSVSENDSQEMEEDEHQNQEDASLKNGSVAEKETVINLDDPSQIPNYGYHEIKKETQIESIHAFPSDGSIPIDKTVVLPDKYVNENLPNTRNQGVYGTCWAHSSIAIAEANLMKQKILGEGEADTSELHLAYFAYHTVADPLGGISGDSKGTGSDGENYLNNGGNIEQATRTLFAWMGTAAEETAPYSDCYKAYTDGLSHDIAFWDIAHIKNAYAVNPLNEREEAKRLLYEYGAISTSYFAVQSGKTVQDGGKNYYFTDIYNYDNNAYYFPIANKGTNHAVTIVGWDDNFSKENFSIQPEGDGAWLIRNSWTTSNSESYEGYFWMSYYDKSMSSTSYAYEMDGASNYDNNYQYDGTYFSTSSGRDICANVFEVKANEVGESLEAIAFETENTNLNYTVEIYTQVAEGGDPSTGRLTESCSGTTKYAGYHTVELPHPVTLNYGEHYAVVVKVEKAGYAPSVSCEWNCSMTYYHTVPETKEGESFYYRDGQWYDWYNYYSLNYSNVGNFCIKAYTTNFEERVQANDILLSESVQAGLTLGVEEEFQVYAKALPINADNTTLIYTSSDENVVTVTDNGRLLGIGKGSATITVATANGIQKQFTVTVIEKVNKIKLTGEQYLYVGNQYTYTVSWEPDFVIPTGKVSFQSDNPDVIRIDKDTGEAVAKGVGTATISAVVDGVTDSLMVEVQIDRYSADFTAKADQNSVITMSWKPVLGAKKYELKRGTQIIATYEEDGRESYSFTDTFYQGIAESTYVDYTFSIYDGLQWNSIGYGVTVGPCKTITYVIPHGTNSELNRSYYRPGEYFSFQEPIADVGYDFAGWYLNQEYTQYTWGINWDCTEDVTVYAKMDPVLYTVTFHSNTEWNKTFYLTVKYDEEFTLSADTFTRPGYELIGWNTKPDGTGTAYEIGQPIKNLATELYASVNLYAQWGAPKYEVTLNANGGTVEKDSIRVAYESAYGTLPAAERAGYTFLGWFTEQSGGTQVVETNIYQHMKDSVLYAQWERNAYTVTLEPGEGTLAEEERTISVYAELTYGELPQPVRKGYVFTGWYLNQNDVLTEITKDTVVNLFEDHQLIAGWEEKPPVMSKITYIISHGENHEENPEQYQEEKELLLKEAIPETGYLFEGWYRDMEYHYFSERISDTDTGDLVFYAKMTPITYKIVYCSNNGIEEKLAVAVKYDQQVSLEQNIFQRDGYLFEGWNTSADGKGTAYASGQNVKNLTTVSEDTVCLYAQWKEIPEDFDGFLMEGLASEYIYTGKAIKPKVKVYHGRKLLTEKKDYTISYKNNTNANDASDEKKAPTIIVSGKGDYTGKASATFVIKPKPITNEEINIPDMVKKYNKKVQKAAPTVKDNGKTLKNKTHYTLEYPDLTEENPNAYKKASKVPYSILVHGKGNYCGTREISFLITEQEFISQAKVSSIKAQTYTGSEIVPEVVVKHKNRTLEEGIDYTIRYDNNIEIGTAKVTVTGDGHYIGTKEVTFKITGVPITKAKVTGVPTSLVYTGQELEAGVAKWKTKPQLRIKVNGKELTLKRSTDNRSGDYTVKYLKNTAKGTGTIVFEGMNGYSGVLKKTFKITAYNIGTDSDKKITVSLPQEIYYEKGGSKPKPVVKFGDTLLTEGIDYTLSYKNNNVVYDGSNSSKVPMITMKGKGNFTGSKTITFNILSKDISELDMVINDKVYQNKVNSYKSVPKIIDINNKTLSAKVDYNNNIIYQYKFDTVLENGTLRYAGESVGSTDIVPVNTTIKVIVEGKGNYRGTIEGEYKLSDFDISKAKITITPQIYTGKEVEPGYEDIKVIYQGEILDGTNYEIIKYSNNIKKGNGTLTIKGIGKFAGTKTVKFTIKSKDILKWSN